MAITAPSRTANERCRPGDPSTLDSTAIGFAGGTPWLVQYAYTAGPVPVDNDYACG